MNTSNRPDFPPASHPDDPSPPREPDRRQGKLQRLIRVITLDIQYLLFMEDHPHRPPRK